MEVRTCRIPFYPLSLGAIKLRKVAVRGSGGSAFGLIFCAALGFLLDYGLNTHGSLSLPYSLSNRSSSSFTVMSCVSWNFLASASHRARRRSDSIYSKRPDESKTACQRKPTAPLALSASEAREKGPFARLPTAPRPSRPAQ